MHYFLQIMNISLSQEIFVNLLQPQDASVIYPFWFSVLFNFYFSDPFVPEAWTKKKILLSSGSHGTSPYPPSPPPPTPAYLKVWISYCYVQYKPAQLLGFRVDGFMPLLLFCYSSTNINRSLFFFSTWVIRCYEWVQNTNRIRQSNMTVFKKTKWSGMLLFTVNCRRSQTEPCEY